MGSVPHRPTFGGDTSDNGRCGTLFGQQDFGVWQYCVHTGLRKGEHGEESGGNEPDGWGVWLIHQTGQNKGREFFFSLYSLCPE